MGVIYEDLGGHEGYALRRLPDGTLTGTLTAETARFGSYVAVCKCRWTGGDHPATEAGYDDALDEWEDLHARPLLAQATPVRIRQMTLEMKQGLVELVDKRPAAGLKAVSELRAWAEAVAARARVGNRALSYALTTPSSRRRPVTGVLAERRSQPGLRCSPAPWRRSEP